MVGEEGIFGGTMKYMEIRENTKDKDIPLGWHWETKAKGSNKIKYLNSPSHKRWIQSIVHIDLCKVVVNTLRIPPREYVHKNEIQRSWHRPTQVVDQSMWFNSMQNKEPY